LPDKVAIPPGLQVSAFAPDRDDGLFARPAVVGPPRERVRFDGKAVIVTDAADALKFAPETE